MSHNLANLFPEERAAMNDARKQALENHQAIGVKALTVESEFRRILAGKSEQKGRWRVWAYDQVERIGSEPIRNGVRKKLNDWLESIGG
ncbi:hypothetical protein [Pseudomonas sp. BN515]|uniref:hypothetical protein n=1 Tax=Pseudomonas sp. BN515 TaxID=2567892 RepID=UPI0024543C44|nr:hypothetical protein [Pseudomonas sp. BN515]MDH4871997.1 hypothetical protein [Pseudomonas sp. BN515]